MAINKTEQNLKMHLGSALQHLKDKDFGAYISVLAAIGADLSELGIDKLTIHPDPSKPSESLSDDLNQPPKLNQSNLTDILATDEATTDVRKRATLFASNWYAPYDKAEVKKLFDQKTAVATETANTIKANTDDLAYEAKIKLNRSDRHNIHKGMALVAIALEEKDEKKDIEEDTKLAKPVEPVNKEDLELDDAIYDAIKSYQTKRQKALSVIGKGLAFATSIMFGLIESGVAAFFLGVWLFSPAGWALWPLLAVAVVLGLAATYVNYCGFKVDVPHLLLGLAGKDKPFQIFLEYEDENGQIQQFTPQKRVAMFAFTFLFALPTGIAIGALGYTSTLGIPLILGVFGISVASAAFPPIAIALAALVAITMTFFIAMSFHAFLGKHKANFLSFIKSPFENISKKIDEKYKPQERPKANKAAKALAFFATGLVGILSIVGLAMAAIAGVNSVTAFIAKTFKASPTISGAIGIAVGGIISFSSRVFFTFIKCAGAAVNIGKLILKNPSDQNSEVDKKGVLFAVIDALMVGIFYLDAFLRPQSSNSIIPMPHSEKFAVPATGCATARELGMGLFGMFAAAKGDRNTAAQTKRVAEALGKSVPPAPKAEDSNAANSNAENSNAVNSNAANSKAENSNIVNSNATNSNAVNLKAEHMKGDHKYFQKIGSLKQQLGLLFTAKPPSADDKSSDQTLAFDSGP